MRPSPGGGGSSASRAPLSDDSLLTAGYAEDLSLATQRDMSAFPTSPTPLGADVASERSSGSTVPHSGCGDLHFDFFPRLSLRFFSLLSAGTHRCFFFPLAGVLNFMDLESPPRTVCSAQVLIFFVGSPLLNFLAAVLLPF